MSDEKSAKGNEPDLQASQAWSHFNHHTPESFWDVATWRDGGWITGSLDVADRKRIALAVMAATRAPHVTTPDDAEGAL